jgi:hypothetical protein
MVIIRGKGRNLQCQYTADRFWPHSDLAVKVAPRPKAVLKRAPMLGRRRVRSPQAPKVGERSRARRPRRAGLHVTVSSQKSPNTNKRVERYADARQHDELRDIVRGALRTR